MSLGVCKIDHYNFELHRVKVGAFLRHRVEMSVVMSVGQVDDSSESVEARVSAYR